LILQNDLYHNYLHSIDERTTDILTKDKVKNLHMCSQTYKESQILKRSTRLSLTIRYVPKTSKLKLKFGK
jgi:alkylated DNA repair protein alkB family protein 6